MAVLAWLFVAAVLGVLEMISLDFVLIMLAAGALGGAAAAAAGAPVMVQAAVAGGVAALGLVAVRPVAIRHLRKTPEILTGVDALIGKKAEILTEVGPRNGLVKIAGEQWTARVEEPWDPIPAGESGTVVAIEGATAVIRPY